MRLRLTPVSSVVAVVAAAVVAAGTIIATTGGLAAHAAATAPGHASHSQVLRSGSQSRPPGSPIYPHFVTLESAIWYRVQPGDSLSGIAARLLGSYNRWPSLYRANRRT
jgi:nucleoid-associated protein YgaU